MSESGVLEIPLGKGVVALIDETDWPLVAATKWRHARHPKGTGYVVGYAPRVNGKNSILSMHRVILNAQPGQWVDHANHNGLDNRRCNIRICTPSQNAQNRKRISGSIPFRGVAKAPQGAGFYSCIAAEGVSYRLGLFATADAAARTYDAACRILHGEFGHLNFPHEEPVPLGPVVCERGKPHPAMAGYIVPSAREIRSAVWEARVAQHKLERLEAERLQVEITANNRRVLAALSPRTAAIAESYNRTGNLSDTAREFGLSRERIRQIVARAIGAGFRRPLDACKTTPRYSEEFKRHAATLAAAEGIRPVSVHLGIAYANLRAWMAMLDGYRAHPAGRPCLSDAAARDARLAAADHGKWLSA